MNQVRRQIRSMLSIEISDSGFRARLRISADFVLLPDHFPGDPILPGICMLQAVLIAAGVDRGTEFRLRHLKSLKLLRPVRPGDELIIDGTTAEADAGDVVITARLLLAGRKCAEFSLIARSGPAGAGATA